MRLYSLAQSFTIQKSCGNQEIKKFGKLCIGMTVRPCILCNRRAAVLSHLQRQKPETKQICLVGVDTTDKERTTFR